MINKMDNTGKQTETLSIALPINKLASLKLN